MREQIQIQNKTITNFGAITSIKKKFQSRKRFPAMIETSTFQEIFRDRSGFGDQDFLGITFFWTHWKMSVLSNTK